MLGRFDYQWRHEPILHGWKPDAAHPWFGGRAQTTVIEDAGARVRAMPDGTVQVDVGDHTVVITGQDLRSRPVRWLFLDEVDGYPGDVDGEGDPVGLAEARTISFGHRAKNFVVSTPTVRGASRIEREFEASDQRRYHVPCPQSGHLQWLQFERLRWPKGRPAEARYHCEGCERPIEERHKPWFVAEANGARWIATAPPDVAAATEEAGTVGYHISGLYSPLGMLSWPRIARAWEAAQGNDAALKTVKNTILGEVWQESGEAPDWERLYERRERWELGTAPADALFLTAGADVQRDRIEVDVWGWGRGLQSWLVDHIVLEGDTAGAQVWAALTALLDRTWPHASGRRMGLARLAVDTGDGLTTQAVYAWARRQGRDRVMAVKGRGGFDRASPVDGPSYVDITEGGRKIRRGLHLWTVAVATFKSETYRWLRLAAPTDEDRAEGRGWPDGFVHLPSGITAEWLRQLTAKQLVTVRTRQGGQRLEWQQIRDRNEALECRVYARAAVWLMGADRWPEERWAQLEAQLAPEPVDDEAPPLAGRTAWQAPRRRRVFTPRYME